MSELNDIQICSLTGEILGSVKCFEDRNTVPFWWLNSTIEQETQIHRSRRAFIVDGVCYRNASRISEGVLCCLACLGVPCLGAALGVVMPCVLGVPWMSWVLPCVGGALGALGAALRAWGCFGCLGCCLAWKECLGCCLACLVVPWVDRALLTTDIPRPVDRCIYLSFE